MQIREYSLPVGWFPHDSAKVTAFLSDFNASGSGSLAVIAPHAGWRYSGHIAARAVANLGRGADTVVILGGHLKGGSSPLFAMEDAVKTPFGYMPIDSQLRSVLFKELNGAEDRYRDNTIEVLLPMVHYFFPDSSILWLRLPADLSSFEAGKIIKREAKKLNGNIRVIGSADLTHYGPNFGFTPHGTGQAALRWVRDVNDAGFIKAVEKGDINEVLRCAEQDYACCSAGAVLGVMGFANGNAELLEYETSADVDEDENPDSFVGYAAFEL